MGGRGSLFFCKPRFAYSVKKLRGRGSLNFLQSQDLFRFFFLWRLKLPWKSRNESQYQIIIVPFDYLNWFLEKKQASKMWVLLLTGSAIDIFWMNSKWKVLLIVGTYKFRENIGAYQKNTKNAPSEFIKLTVVQIDF